MKILRAVLFAALLQPLVCHAEEGGMDYDAVNKGMLIMKSQKKGDIDCVPFFIKSELKDQPLDPVKADFRLKSKDGETLTLKVEPFKPTAKFAATRTGEEAVKGEFTHIIWVPKALEKFKGGLIVHNFPKGSISMSYFVFAGSDLEKEPATQP